jgi:hypothetical protein
MSLEEDLKKILGPTKELRGRMKRSLERPAPTLEEVERQFRASKVIQEKYKGKGPPFKSGPERPDA